MDSNSDQSTTSWNLRQLIESVRNNFVVALAESNGSPIESYLPLIPESAQQIVLADLIAIEIQHRRDHGEHPLLREYIERFPHEAEWLRRHFVSMLDSSEIAHSTQLAPGATPECDQKSPSMPLGDVDRYQRVSVLGRGGFGEVWSARDALLNRMVALKQLRLDRRLGSDQAQNLLKEGQRLAQLDHPNIVRVLDACAFGDQIYLVSELMSGGTLEEQLNTQGLPPELAARWIVSLAKALHHAHLRGIVHRDIKPSNVLFDNDGEPHLADFGLAISEEEITAESPQMMGSIYYMPPEQARGESHLADPRSDVYSLGVVFFRMLTGRLPYPSKAAEEYRKEILTREPRPLRAIKSDIPITLESICLKCLNKSVSHRPATALEVSEMIDNWLNEQHRERHVVKSGLSSTLFVTLSLAVVLLFAIVAIQRPHDFLNPPKNELPADVLREKSLMHPEVVAWMPFDTHDSFAYNKEHDRFEFDAFGEALFRTATHSGSMHTFVVDITVRQMVGRAGLFWCLNKSEDGTLHCWSVFAGQNEHDPGFSAHVSEFTIGDGGAGRTAVNSGVVIRSVPVPSIDKGRIQMKVKASREKIEELWINDQQLLSEPIILPKVDWIEANEFGMGFGGHMGRCFVTKCVRN